MPQQIKYFLHNWSSLFSGLGTALIMLFLGWLKSSKDKKKQREKEKQEETEAEAKMNLKPAAISVPPEERAKIFKRRC